MPAPVCLSRDAPGRFEALADDVGVGQARRTGEEVEVHRLTIMYRSARLTIASTSSTLRPDTETSVPPSDRAVATHHPRALSRETRHHDGTAGGMRHESAT